MANIYVTDERNPHELAISAVANVLKEGGLALYPTETVYGLGVAVVALDGKPGDYERIFKVKKRNRAQTTPWLVAGTSALDEYGIDVKPSAYKLAQAFWPGALTLVVKASDKVPRRMQAADGTIALRVSRSAIVSHLIRECGSPLATTSANTHGWPAATKFDDVEPAILEGVDAAINSGDTMMTEASTIVNCVDDEIVIVREGAIPAHRIHRALA